MEETNKFENSQEKVNSIMNKIEFLLLEADEVLQQSFRDALEKDSKDSGVIMQNIWGVLSANESNAAKLDYLLDKLIKIYKDNDPNKERIYETIKNFFLYSNKMTDLIAKKISYRSKVNDLDGIKDFVIGIMEKGKISKGEGKGEDVLKHALNKFNLNGGMGFVAYLMSDNSAIFQRILRSFMDKETSEISFDSMSGQKIGREDDDSFDDSNAINKAEEPETEDGIGSPEQKLLWNKFNQFVRHLISVSKFAKKNPKVVDLYDSFVKKEGRVDTINKVSEFEEIGMLPYLIRPVFERVGDVIKNGLDEAALIEFIEGYKFSTEGSSKAYVVGVDDQSKIDSVVNKMKEVGLYDSSVEKMMDFLKNPHKYSSSSINDLMGKYSTKAQKNPANTIKLRLTDIIGRIGKTNGVLIDGDGKLKYTMGDFVSWMNLPKDKEMEIAKAMGFKSLEDFETSGVFRNLANKLLNNFKERSERSARMEEGETIMEDDGGETYYDHLIQMYGNF